MFANHGKNKWIVHMHKQQSEEEREKEEDKKFRSERGRKLNR